jgi:hypothetical protein
MRGVSSLSVKAEDVLRTRVAQLLGLRRQTQAEFARGIHRSGAWVSDFLAGKVGTSLATVDLMANHLGVNSASLFDETIMARTEALAEPLPNGHSSQPLADAANGLGTPADEELAQMLRDVPQQRLFLGLVSAWEMLPSDKRKEFVQHVINYAAGMASRSRTGTDPNS